MAATNNIVAGLVGTGTATNDSASPGNVGEYVTATVAVGSAVALTTATPANVTSISLTAGDWLVSGNINFAFGATTNMTQLNSSISLTTNVLGTQAGGSGLGTDPTTTWSQAAAVPVNTIGVDCGPVRVTLAATTTVYLVAQGTFTVSTCSAYGTIRAWRIR